MEQLEELFDDQAPQDLVVDVSESIFEDKHEEPKIESLQELPKAYPPPSSPDPDSDSK